MSQTTLKKALARFPRRVYVIKDPRNISRLVYLTSSRVFVHFRTVNKTVSGLKYRGLAIATC